MKVVFIRCGHLDPRIMADSATLESASAAFAAAAADAQSALSAAIEQQRQLQKAREEFEAEVRRFEEERCV